MDGELAPVLVGDRHRDRIDTDPDIGRLILSDDQDGVLPAIGAGR